MATLSKNISRKGPRNRRSLGFAPPNEQKINPIESISISSVHFTLNLPQASRLLGMTKGGVALPCSVVADDVFVVSWRCKKPASSRISIVCQTS
jgi:hypothetical protein